MKSPEIEKYKGIVVCADCESELSSPQIMERVGVCPYCGIISGGGVVRTKVVAVEMATGIRVKKEGLLK